MGIGEERQEEKFPKQALSKFGQTSQPPTPTRNLLSPGDKKLHPGQENCPNSQRPESKFPPSTSQSPQRRPTRLPLNKKESYHLLSKKILWKFKAQIGVPLYLKTGSGTGPTGPPTKIISFFLGQNKLCQILNKAFYLQTLLTSRSCSQSSHQYQNNIN